MGDLFPFFEMTIEPMTMTTMTDGADLETTCQELAARAQEASRELAGIGGQQRTDALLRMAEGLAANAANLIQANAKDIARADEFGLSDAPTPPSSQSVPHSVANDPPWRQIT